MYRNARGKKDYGPSLAQPSGRVHKEVPESRLKKKGAPAKERKAARERKAEAARIERMAAIERTR
jgi:hypothetical protein